MSGEELNYNELILEELQTQTKILQDSNDSIISKKDISGVVDIFLPLLFIYLLFGLFIGR